MLLATLPPLSLPFSAFADMLFTFRHFDDGVAAGRQSLYADVG